MLIMGKTSLEDLPNTPEVPAGSLEFGKQVMSRTQTSINTPEGLAGLESFPAGKEYSFAFWADEFHFVVSGSATVKYTSPPLHQDVVETTVEAGDVYLIRSGSRVRWFVDESEPFVHYFAAMPGFDYGLPTWDEKE